MGMFDWLTDGVAGLLGSGASAAASAKIARDNRNFQERMTKHRYQYQMQDMRKAGLNPMLAMGSPPPSAPPGAMAQIPDLGQSATAAKQAAANVALTEAKTQLTENEAVKSGVQAELWGVPASALDWTTTQMDRQWDQFKKDLGRGWEGTKKDFEQVLDFYKQGAHFGQGNSAKSLERRRDIRNPPRQLE